MAWFRRRRDSDTDPAEATEPAGPEASGAELVPVVSPMALERTEHALRLLAEQAGEMHDRMTALERRVETLAVALLDRMDVPTYDDVLGVQLHSARVAAEVVRLEVNVASRLDQLRAEVRAAGGSSEELDLRALTPNDTGWDRLAAS